MEIQDNFGFTYKLNENDSTAAIVKLTQKNKDVVIPSFIENNSKRYIITAIESHAISSKDEMTISFADDSEIRTFKSYAFYGSITSLQIPKSLEYFEYSSVQINFEKNHYKVPDPRIYVSKENQFFSSSDNKYLYGKSQKELDCFDTLVYVTPDIEEAIIPTNVKIIKSRALSNCTSLKFSEGSQIETIEEYQSS